MSEKELDEILKEVRARNGEPVESAAPAEEAANDAVQETEVLTPEETAPLAEEPPMEEAAPAAEEQGAMDILKVAEEHSDLSAIEEPPLIRSHPEPPEKKNGKKVVIAVIAVILVIALALGAFFFMKGRNKPADNTPTSSETTTNPIQMDENLANPLNGELGYNTLAIGKRPVAVVVENEYSTESVRPQWAIDKADMIMEGETEFSTRLLFFWADLNTVPKQVGPSRSARPPFIRFSQLWDSIFIHTGLSRSKDNYVGADTVFEAENIDHINLLAQAEDGTYFGRDNSRKTAVEHTGYLNGENVAKLIDNNQISTTLRDERFTQFEFNDEAQDMGDQSAKTATFKWSNRCPKTGVFTYDESKDKYVTTDFDSKYGESNLEVTTLIYLLDETEYIVKENYKGSGNSETYCDYHLAGGTGKLVSHGTATDINWGVENGKLVIKTTDGQDVKLNRGKIYFGFGSSNNGGSITVE